ncbi:MAG TPA: N-acetylmuramoyl-L-alanine amidase CwlD [Bacillota bacterium]|nr:N-acetylmuramoyl-L-alanine amidase CwlD [Peptococcaceae bacterium MAG4]HPU36000.1 N-acetylmuramoyl-L-alanine amidase CwlD [Bacillota bacterium]HPZ43556.1 N-acetylmuramoyl-L-alanine amidase CwlD [Bacillota bacterium]HQD76077.1 N-acetylmuramoyl-L-alanine amidase CwlD [Bacillota bacterium]HUM58766.1 N-acetylmuramoyl-L-alanine amidase CwlD [Bacillota bacterium]
MAFFSARTRLPGKRFILVLTAVVLAVLFGFRISSARLEERYISTLAWAVAGKLIVIDPGHGGEDPGAVGASGVYEKDIVLEVSKKLAEILRQAGAEVLLTRENDRDLSDPGNHSLYQSRVQDLTKRVEIANQRGADLFLSIHVNSFPDRREGGAQTFSQPGSVEGKRLAESIQRELNRFLVYPGRAAKQVDYFTNRIAKMPSAIVEIGFITNPREEKLMVDPEYQQKIAYAIYAGVVRYFAEPSQAVTPGSRI